MHPASFDVYEDPSTDMTNTKSIIHTSSYFRIFTKTNVCLNLTYQVAPISVTKQFRRESETK